MTATKAPTRQRKTRRQQPNAVYPSVEALAAEIGISRHACYQAIKRGLIPHYRFGRRIVLPKASIHRWLESAKATGVLVS